MRAPVPIKLTWFLACALIVAPAFGAEFRSIGEHPAVLYDAPSQRANKVAILGRSYPVEILVRLDRWSKVRDATGDLAWVENSALSEKRLVMVSAPTAEVRVQPAPTAAIVFEAQSQVILEPTGPAAAGWLPVRHRDGQQGFVKISQVWGE